MSCRRKLLITVAFLHLGMISLSSAKISIGQWVKNLPFLSLVDLYGYVTGAGYHYGFFAPGVTSQLRVNYIALDRGSPISSGEIQTKNIEITYRLHNLLEYFWETENKPEVRRAFAASLAGKIFSRHPKATDARIEIQAFVLPSMAETRNGATPEWEDFYTASFERGKT